MEITEVRVRRDNLRTTAVAQRNSGSLQAGQVLARVDKFALTANNVSYGVAGDLIGYWKFFPAEDPWGILPVWGFADVVESRCPDIPVGDRFWGFLPMASHVVLQPGEVRADAFVDTAEHRQPLPGLYNRYQRVAGDPPGMEAFEEARCLYFPLFTTAFVIHDFLSDNDWFGARQLVILSASSKTGFGLADMAAKDPTRPVAVVGVTSPANAEFVSSLGTYDKVVTYDGIGDIDASLATVVVDMAGSAKVIEAVHRHLGENVVYSCSVGATHWTDTGAPKDLPGAAPEFFFAPAQIAKRDAEWGPGELLRRAFVRNLQTVAATNGLLSIERVHGAETAQHALDNMVAGRTPPERGLMLSI